MNYNNTPIDWSKVNDIVLSAKKILLTTHENPDGDGLGSEVALYPVSYTHLTLPTKA